jgi:hypothetical protein
MRSRYEIAPWIFLVAVTVTGLGRMRKPFMAGDRTGGLVNQYHSG